MGRLVFSYLGVAVVSFFVGVYTTTSTAWCR